jgi:hypothetical protein
LSPRVTEATRNVRESDTRAYISNAAVKIFCGGMRREDVGRIEPPQKIIVVADAVPRQTGNRKRGKETALVARCASAATTIGMVQTNWQWGRLRRRFPLRYSPRRRGRFWEREGRRKKLEARCKACDVKKLDS